VVVVEIGEWLSELQLEYYKQVVVELEVDRQVVGGQVGGQVVRGQVGVQVEH
jgi:hypothetical protein